jgi:hypothetical protein
MDGLTCEFLAYQWGRAWARWLQGITLDQEEEMVQRKAREEWERRQVPFPFWARTDWDDLDEETQAHFTEMARVGP